MLQQFINRTEELNILNRRFKSANPEFIIIYGRRRVGKTELITHFMKNKSAVYYLAEEKRYNDNLNEMKKMMEAHLEDDEFQLLRFDNWAQLCKSISSRIKKRTIITIDEFPYLVEESKSIPSEFQKAWDMYLSKSEHIVLIIIGSSVRMMEKLLGEKSPLFGRRTAQLEIRPMDIFQIKEFLPKYSIEDRIKAYGCLDGIPLYLKQFDSNLKFCDNMKNTFFRRDALLYNEAEILLKQEFRQPANYFAILKAISLGITKQTDIVNYTGIEKSIISKYIQNLIEIRIIKTEYPITDRKDKQKNRRFIFSDNYFKFWFRFIYPVKVFIESSQKEALETMKKDYNQYMGLIFEKVAAEYLIKKRPFRFTKLGRWWQKDKDIDIVAINEETKDILFCECKWKKNVNPKSILAELKEKSSHVSWKNQKRDEHYAIFAKSFTEKIDDSTVMLFDLDDLENIKI